MKYLPLYKEWINDNWFPFLCLQLDNDPLFEYFKPNDDELDKHIDEGYLGFAWGMRHTDHTGDPTPLRQNIILFLAAMNNEL